MLINQTEHVTDYYTPRAAWKGDICDEMRTVWRMRIRPEGTYNICCAALCPSMCRWVNISWPWVQRSPGFPCRCTRSRNPRAGSAHCGSGRDTRTQRQSVKWDWCSLLAVFPSSISVQSCLVPYGRDKKALTGRTFYGYAVWIDVPSRSELHRLSSFMLRACCMWLAIRFHTFEGRSFRGFALILHFETASIRLPIWVFLLQYRIKCNLVSFKVALPWNFALWPPVWRMMFVQSLTR